MTCVEAAVGTVKGVVAYHHLMHPCTQRTSNPARGKGRMTKGHQHTAARQGARAGVGAMTKLAIAIGALMTNDLQSSGSCSSLCTLPHLRPGTSKG